MTRSILTAGISLLLCLGSVSCIRTSTVVKVKKDGSGEIVSRYHFSPQVLALAEQFGGEAGQAQVIGFGFDLIEDIIEPDRESLEADAANFGEGVAYSKHEVGNDADGWKGYTVVYAFEDVNRIRIDQNSVPGKAREFVESTGQEIDPEKGGRLDFSLEGEVLTIQSSLAEGSVKEMINEEQLEQAKQMGMKPSEALQMMAVSTEGMRAGFFIRIDGGIAETNAEHVTGNLIIMSDAEVSKVLRDPDFAEFADRAAEDPGAITAEAVRELFGKIEAMTIELSEEITVRFE